MRLINVATLALEEFVSAIPPYAILSHCWCDEEVSFKDWQHPLMSGQKKKGFAKIRAACDEARSQGCCYLWCDTNCIDKRSSAELSEAINSMFEWYRKSSICIAYLEDVSVAPQDPGDTSRQEFLSAFCASRWFTRGWTLQELLAPPNLRFYNRDWQFLGLRSDLADHVNSTTGIPHRLLNPVPGGSSPRLDIRRELDRTSIAMRMSWLSKRETTRIEDMAYCTLGIFDISMPLLYGEGTKAFQRLQEEIVRVTNDMTIFCWHWDDLHVPDDWGSILAPSPFVFRDSGRYVEKFESYGPDCPPYSLTNAGLSVTLPVVSTRHLFLAFLPVHHLDYEPNDILFAVVLLHPRLLGAHARVRSRLPPLAVPGRREILGVGRKSMYIPFRQAQIRGHLSEPAAIPQQVDRLLRSDLDFEAGVLIVLVTRMHTHIDESLAPKHILPLKFHPSSGFFLGVLPVALKGHNITVWIGFAAKQTSLSQGRRTRDWCGTGLAFTRSEVENQQEDVGSFERLLGQWLATNNNGLPETENVTELPVQLSCRCILRDSTAISDTSELAVAYVAIRHWRPEQNKFCVLCQAAWEEAEEEEEEGEEEWKEDDETSTSGTDM